MFDRADECQPFSEGIARQISKNFRRGSHLGKPPTDGREVDLFVCVIPVHFAFACAPARNTGAATSASEVLIEANSQVVVSS